MRPVPKSHPEAQVLQRTRRIGDIRRTARALDGERVEEVEVVEGAEVGIRGRDVLREGVVWELVRELLVWRVHGVGVGCVGHEGGYCGGV